VSGAAAGPRPAPARPAAAPVDDGDADADADADGAVARAATVNNWLRKLVRTQQDANASQRRELRAATGAAAAAPPARSPDRGSDLGNSDLGNLLPVGATAPPDWVPMPPQFVATADDQVDQYNEMRDQNVEMRERQKDAMATLDGDTTDAEALAPGDAEFLDSIAFSLDGSEDYWDIGTGNT
jgi:hypothetical protein